MASRSGHSYNNIYTSDASRNLFGDVYNQYGPSPDQQAFRAVLDSLRFDGMDDRLERLNSAERGTFDGRSREETPRAQQIAMTRAMKVGKRTMRTIVFTTKAANVVSVAEMKLGLETTRKMKNKQTKAIFGSALKPSTAPLRNG